LRVNVLRPTQELSGNRTLAIIMVVISSSRAGYAIVTGLAYNVIKKAAEDLKTFDVEEQPPPPEEPPPPPKDMPKVPPPPMTPPPLVRMEAPPPPIQTVTPTSAAAYIPPVAPAPPPPPPPPRKVQSAQSAKGDLRSLFSADDYPAAAQAAGAEGTAQAQLTIGPTAAWSAATCPLDRQRRARFGDLQHPSPPRQVHAGARQQRQPTTDTVTTPPIVGGSKANQLFQTRNFRRKAQLCKQHPPQVRTLMA
jgi:protein TonB